MECSNPIFSTKNRYKAGAIIGVIFIVLGWIFMLASTLTIIGIPIGIALYILSNWAGFTMAAPAGSFVTLYDDYVEGVSIPKKWWTKGYGNRYTFKLAYADINHVSFKPGVVMIMFNGGQYEVQANACERQVVDLIMQQKEKTR